MSNHLQTLLTHWYPARDSTDWVLGTVYKTEGPCYRKAGAMMLFNGQGQQFGMLSGGCLESDIQTHARKVMQQGRSIMLCYDGSDEDDLAFQLGIGCGGTVYICLYPIRAENHYLQLDQVYQALLQRQPGNYQLHIDEGPTAEGLFSSTLTESDRAELKTDRNGILTLRTPVAPPPHLLVVGGGIDARPVITMAHQLGWQTTLWDPRPANGRREFFMDADQLLSGPVENLTELDIEAAILMSHNIGMDASALQTLSGSGLRYLALLGPINRKQQVLAQAGVTEGDLPCPLAGPAGLSIGGELPESIALSILSECHAALHNRNGGSFSGVGANDAT